MTCSLASLLAALPPEAQPMGVGDDRLIAGVTADSRQIRPGMLFVAVAGSKEDGQRYIAQAVAHGATAVLHGAIEPPPALPDGVTRLVHPTPRRVLAWLVAALHDHPGAALKVVAITGTNGKTTTAGMVAAILNENGLRTGVIGTTGISWPGVIRDNSMTTPGAAELQGLLAEMRVAGCATVAMEASSHALDQYRVDAIPFAVTVFTNLTRDHLDYHGDVESYFRAKSRLFLELPSHVAVINGGDGHGARLIQERRALGLATTSYNAPEDEGGVWATEIHLGWEATQFQLHGAGSVTEIVMQAAGAFNVNNALAAAATGFGLGLTPGQVAAGLAAFQAVPGRMQSVRAGQPFPVVVDYAHTPDALERLLTTARSLTSKRLLVLFGCGGDRDAGKRPLMGAIAARLAELVVVTDDNPRSEDPALIRRAIRAGMVGGAAQVVEVGDRRHAIEQVLRLARPGDAVLLAGKGHETMQIIGSKTLPFDDALVAKTVLQGMFNG